MKLTFALLRTFHGTKALKHSTFIDQNKIWTKEKSREHGNNTIQRGLTILLPAVAGRQSKKRSTEKRLGLSHKRMGHSGLSIRRKFYLRLDPLVKFVFTGK